MKKRLLSLFLAIFLLAVPARAAENSMENFVRGAGGLTYTGQFSDLPAGSTFYENVTALYEYGLSKGRTDGAFGLTDNVTVSQIIIFAGRIRSLYRTGDAESGPAAYKTEAPQAACLPYLDYLKAEGVLGDELDGVLFTPATRGQMAHVLANVLPEEAVPAINHDIVTEVYAAGQYIPDVDESTPYRQDILSLYHRGISQGSDEYGSFQPEAPITRGAAAAMLTRLVDPDLRILLTYYVPDVSQLTLADLVEPGEYIPSPVTGEEMDACIRHMLANDSRQLELTYEDISREAAQSVMLQAIQTVKTYTEQGYNSVQCIFLSDDSILLTFSAASVTDDQLPEYRAASMAAAIAVHDQLWANGDITPDMTELEKARAYYIWVCLNSAYDDGADSQSISHIPYSLFQHGAAVCDGYTGAYNMLLKLEGIDCTGRFTEDHIWTVATLDGTEYHIDVTWGDLGDSASASFFAMTPEFSADVHGVSLD